MCLIAFIVLKMIEGTHNSYILIPFFLNGSFKFSADINFGVA
jgi:hypothetical protein